ncbi:hypothetical protein QUF54_01875 [Candidatus Marithioploca araucensis]|uniref:Uncharacterized protein n=1 Tax=Candidatus Marithioploca araucensis TaxID=70273 RepID=A0ABT7VQZ1_9GAMM|nr:hypothetical protein [Candidatus Marithioploca araucensis]
MEREKPHPGRWKRNSNGDVMYSTVFTFQRGYFQVGSLGDLFCTNNPEG